MFKTDGPRILDNEKEIQLYGLNWAGFEHKTDGVAFGLWERPLDEMLEEIRPLGFNAIRVCIGRETLEDMPVAPGLIGKNPEFKGLSSLGCLTLFLDKLRNHGFYFLLDNHTNGPDPKTGEHHVQPFWHFPEYNKNGTYVRGYTEEEWLADNDKLAVLALGYPRNCIGIDLKNEPHNDFNNNIQMGWGTGPAEYDWKRAVELSASRILKLNPNLLIFVEGMERWDSTYGWTGWAMNVSMIKERPLNLPKDKIVLSPHVYGPTVWGNQDYMTAHDFPHNMPVRWERDYGCMANDYPIAFGEFGGRATDRPGYLDKTWHEAFIAYNISKGIRHFFYWSLNPNSGDTGGIYKDDWRTFEQHKLDLLRPLWTDRATFVEHIGVDEGQSQTYLLPYRAFISLMGVRIFGEVVEVEDDTDQVLFMSMDSKFPSSFSSAWMPSHLVTRIK